MEEEGAPAPRRSSAFWVVLAALVFAASGIGALVFSRIQSRERRGFADVSGFNLDHAAAAARPASSPAARPAGQPQSSLGMVTGALPGMQFGAKTAGGQGRPSAEATFARSCRASEARIHALAEAYTRRYPVIQQYGRDWMSYPELKKLNDDYFRDHDPVKFLRGLAASPNFPKLVRKYAAAPEVQAFAKDALRQAPGELMTSGLSLVSQDGTINRIAATIVAALGLPPSLLSSEPGKIDQKAVMTQILNNNPEIQKALENNPQQQPPR